MEKELIIKKADISDIEQLVRLRIMMRMEREKDTTCDIESFNILTRQYYEKHLQDDSYISWIALKEEKIIATSGMCFCCVPPTFENLTGKVAYIMNMYTIPESRNGGIATRLLDRIMKDARDRECFSVLLSPSNMGRKIYSKYGFKDVNDFMIYTFNE